MTDREPGTAYHETITDFRRSLIQGHLMWAEMQEKYQPARKAWLDARKADPEGDHPRDAVDAGMAAMMAAGYSYALAAVIRVAQRDLGSEAAGKLAGVADDLLTNGDFDALNADVLRDGEAPGRTSQGLALTFAVPPAVTP